MRKDRVIKELRAHLAALFDARFEGSDGVRYARVQGFADGYMQALHDLALVESRDLLSLVNEERRLAAGRADTLVPARPSRPPVASYA